MKTIKIIFTISILITTFSTIIAQSGVQDTNAMSYEDAAALLLEDVNTGANE